MTWARPLQSLERADRAPEAQSAKPQPRKGQKRYRMDPNKTNQTCVQDRGNTRGSLVSGVMHTSIHTSVIRHDFPSGSWAGIWLYKRCSRRAEACAIERDLLVASTGRVVTSRRSVVGWTASWAARAYAARRRRTTSVVRTTAAVHVGVIVATGWWAGPGIVRIVRVARARWAILIRRHAATRRRATITSLTSIIKFARWGAATVVIPARAVTTRRTAAIVVIIIRCGRVATAAAVHGRARSVPITAPVIRTTRASVRSSWLERRGWRWIGDVLSAGDFLTLELTTVQLLNGSLQIGGGLVFDESGSG